MSRAESSALLRCGVFLAVILAVFLFGGNQTRTSAAICYQCLSSFQCTQSSFGGCTCSVSCDSGGCTCSIDGLCTSTRGCSGGSPAANVVTLPAWWSLASAQAMVRNVEQLSPTFGNIVGHFAGMLRKSPKFADGVLSSRSASGKSSDAEATKTVEWSLAIEGPADHSKWAFQLTNGAFPYDTSGADLLELIVQPENMLWTLYEDTRIRGTGTVPLEGRSLGTPKLNGVLPYLRNLISTVKWALGAVNVVL